MEHQPTSKPAFKPCFCISANVPCAPSFMSMMVFGPALLAASAIMGFSWSIPIEPSLEGVISIDVDDFLVSRPRLNHEVLRLFVGSLPTVLSPLLKRAKCWVVGGWGQLKVRVE